MVRNVSHEEQRNVNIFSRVLLISQQVSFTFYLTGLKGSIKEQEEEELDQQEAEAEFLETEAIEEKSDSEDEDKKLKSQSSSISKMSSMVELVDERVKDILTRE